MKRIIFLFSIVMMLTAQAREDSSAKEQMEFIPGSDDELSAEMAKEIYTGDDKDEREKEDKKKAVQKKAPEKATSQELNLMISKVAATKMLFKQLAEKTTLPLRDRAVCWYLFAAYTDLEMYMSAMMTPTKDLELLLAFILENLGDIYFFYSQRFTTGVSGATSEKIKESKYQYVDTGRHQGLVLELIENMITRALNVIENAKKKNEIWSIFEFNF